MTDRLNPEALEAACAGFYNDPLGLTNWQRLCSADPALADKYRAGMNAAVSAYLAALPAPRTITTVEELEAKAKTEALEEAAIDSQMGPVAHGWNASGIASWLRARAEQIRETS